MDTDTAIGDCPRCESDVASRHVLIEYEDETGGGRWAECPGCREVVAPE